MFKARQLRNQKQMLIREYRVPYSSEPFRYERGRKKEGKLENGEKKRKKIEKRRKEEKITRRYKKRSMGVLKTVKREVYGAVHCTVCTLFQYVTPGPGQYKVPGAIGARIPKVASMTGLMRSSSFRIKKVKYWRNLSKMFNPNLKSLKNKSYYITLNIKIRVICFYET